MFYVLIRFILRKNTLFPILPIINSQAFQVKTTLPDTTMVSFMSKPTMLVISTTRLTKAVSEYLNSAATCSHDYGIKMKIDYS